MNNDNVVNMTDNNVSQDNIEVLNTEEINKETEAKIDSIGDTDENADLKVTKKTSKKKVYVVGVSIAVAIATIFGIIVYQNMPTQRFNKSMDLGNKYLQELDYESAIVTYKNAIGIAPNNIEAYIGLAKAYEGKGDYESAIKVYEDAQNLQGIELSEETIKSLVVLYKQVCRESFDTGKYDVAEEKAIKILSYNSSEKETIDLLCAIYLIYAEKALSNSDYDSAEKYYSLVLKYDPNNIKSKEALANLEEIKKVVMFESALSKMAKRIIDDSAKYDFSDALILSDEYKNAVVKLTKPVFFKQDNGLYIGVYPNGFIYYGEMIDGKRNGKGYWYYGSKYFFYMADCMWNNDKPNGEAIIEDVTNEEYLDKEPGHTYGLQTYTYVNVIDGIYEGDAKVIWNMDSGEIHEWNVIYESGIMQGTFICINCGADLSDKNKYVCMIYGM